MKRYSVIQTSLLIVLMSCAASELLGQSVTPALGISTIVRNDQSGRLAYLPTSPNGDRLIDFSNVGYKGGGVRLPDVPASITLRPIPNSTNDAPRIQEAINAVSRLKPDVHGIRGAVLLTKGRYVASDTIAIETSGVVLRGEGDSESGTVIVDVMKRQHAFVQIHGAGSLRPVPDTQTEITDEYVPVGTRVIHVADASFFTVGDQVCVNRPATREWLHELGTDNLPKDFPRVRDWTTEQYNLLWERTIVSIQGNEITLDAPIVDALNRKLSRSYLHRYTYDGRISQVGVENLRLESSYDPTIKHDVMLEQIKNGLNSSEAQKDYPQTLADEQHGWSAIEIEKAEHCWVRNVTSAYFGYSCVRINKTSKHNTVQDCRYIDPVSVIQGGRRYSFYIAGQLNLVQRCYSRDGRHDFVLSSQTCGPNVFFDCRGDHSWSMTEAHHRWAQGCLWDNVVTIGPWSWMEAVNRSSSGTGHGWSGVNMVFWNCDAKFFFIQKPPTGQNFALGRKHREPYVYFKSFEYDFSEAMKWIEFHAKKKFPYASGATMIGDGHIEFPNSLVSPRSLYLHQLNDRLGMQAVTNVATEEQVREYLQN